MRLGDLGIAKELQANDQLATTCLGTPYYMSPELMAQQPYTVAADIWALGYACGVLVVCLSYACGVVSALGVPARSLLPAIMYHILVCPLLLMGRWTLLVVGPANDKSVTRVQMRAV